MANEFKIKKGLIVTGATGGTALDVQGSQGQLFSVTDNLSGSIFAVSDISGVPILDVNSSGLSTFDGDVNLPDNKKILLGTGNDLEIYHDGSHSYINDAGTGALKILASQFEINNAANTENIATFTQNGAVSLFYNNAQKLATTSTGVSVTGNLVASNDITATGDLSVRDIAARDIAARDATLSGQGFSAATSSGDASSTLTTKGYVDGLITGATIYRGAWDPSGGGYGSPDLSGVTQTSGYYYICSAAGTAEPNGTGTEPDTWETGDWVIYNDVSGTGQWQKIDNSSVLSGVGTGQTVALWEGAGSVTDSETLGNAPITVSGNNTTFAGIATGTSFSSSTDSGININGITMTRVAVNSAIRVGNGLETLGLLRSYAGLNVATSTVLGSTTQGNTLIVTSGQGSLNTAFSSAGNGGYTQYQSGNDGIYGYIGSGSHLLSPVVNDNDFVLRAQGEFAVSIAATEKMRINSSGNATFAGTGTFTGGGNTLMLKKGTGSPAIAFAGTATDPEASALIEGIAGGGLKFYISNGGTIGTPAWVARLTIAAGGAATFSGALSSVGYSGTSGTFSTSVTAAGNSNSFGNTSIAALSATSGTFSLSVTAAGNSNSFGATTVTSNLTTNGVLTIQNAAPYIQWKNVAGTRLSYIQHNATNLVMSADTGQIQLDTAANNDILINPGGTGKVGIGTTIPSYKLTVSGGIQAGGKVTYTKSYGSLDTTGNAVAGLTTSTNGQSAGFTFTCFGHSGGYQKIVYSCYNGGGNWYASKVIDEGTNQLDVVASANSTTITFTFKSISGTMSYTPRVTVEAVGTAINSTYA